MQEGPPCLRPWTRIVELKVINFAFSFFSFSRQNQKQKARRQWLTLKTTYLVYVRESLKFWMTPLLLLTEENFTEGN